MYIRGLNRFRTLIGLRPQIYIEERKRAAARHLSKTPVVIDAGAHNGTDTRVMAHLWPLGTIHAFEPVPSSFQKLVELNSNCQNVKTYPLALASQSGPRTMYISSGNTADSSSLLAPKEHLLIHPQIKFDETICVQAITLDDWAAAHEIDRVDFLWLDMQGGELDAMRAGPKIMATVRVVLTEVSYVDLYENAPLADEMKSWLSAQGFRIRKEWRDSEDSGDVLFVR